MNDEGFELIMRTIRGMQDRITALEEAQPAPLTYPPIEPNRLDRLHEELQEWAASKKGNPC